MRMLHISDTHLGRRVGRHSRDGEFDAVLAEIIEIARAARPDLFVHTGDLFDVRMPAVDELSRATGALRRLSEIAPVVVIAGNHDSPRLFEFFDRFENEISADRRPPGRIRYLDRARPPDQGGIYQYPAGGGEQTIRLAALPFVHQNRALEGFEDPAAATHSYAEHMRQIQSGLEDGLREGSRADRDVLVFAAHLFVEGAIPSYSERRIDIADNYATTADSLPRVAYGALGHIHKPQAIARAGFTGRYAGSPLQLDFGEAGEAKSVVLVEARPGRKTTVELVPLAAGRQLAAVTGTLEQIAAQAERLGDAFVKVTVDTSEPARYLAEQVAKVLPRAILVAVEERCAASAVTVLDRSSADREQPGEQDLFRAYLAQAGVRGVNADHVLASFGEMLAAAQREQPGEFGEEALLRAAIDGEPADCLHHAGLLTPPADEQDATAGETIR